MTSEAQSNNVNLAAENKRFTSKMELPGQMQAFLDKLNKQPPLFQPEEYKKKSERPQLP